MYLRTIISFYFALLLLVSCIILPLGDFSLMNDLPGMYSNYKKLVPPAEAGIADFIGDYILGGKALLGHNKHDKAENSSNPVQFQHIPAGSYFLYSKFETLRILTEDIKTHYPSLKTINCFKAFHPELFRPPLA
jgi:hypothetical protein